MVTRPDLRTALVGLAGIGVLFIPIPIVTQFIGVPLLVYACYLYWGRESATHD